jgi:hypothetical protein
MTIVPPTDWQELEPLFAEALTLPSGERLAFVERGTSSPAVKTELTRLLAAHERAGGFLDRLDPGQIADLLEGSAPLNETIGRYEVLRRLGRGGMGVVYLARDPRLDRQVALKLLPALLGANADARRRFAEEARAASALDHPHIGTIYEIDETPDGRPYIAMAYYEGGTLAQRLRGDALSVREALGMAIQIADALGAAHERGIVHCDVKPANVVLSPAGTAKVVDFGLARIAGGGDSAGATAGTLAYMSPEHLRGRIDARSDVWSIGVTLYEMLMGFRPFEGADRESMLRAIRAGNVPPITERRPDVPNALLDLVHRCLAPDPDARPADGRALLAELGPIEAAMAAEPHRRTPRLARRIALAAVTVLAVVAVAGGLWLRSSDDPSPVAIDTSAIAVMPFGVVAGDTALARLGRELVVTVSAGLIGTGELRAVEPTTVLAHASESEPPVSLERAATLARTLGAGRLIHGTLVRAGSGVRLDVGVFTSPAGTPIERFVVHAPDDGVAALSDSVTLTLLRGGWAGREFRPPSIDALRTSSLPALRAYLDGERAIARGRLRLAPRLFAEAVAHDSTFLFARWRHVYSLNWHGEAVDGDAVRAIFDRRHDLPDADRLLIESWMIRDPQERLERQRDLARLYPDYWPGWFELANTLVHVGPYLGYPVADARAALERVIELNPALVPAWEHLMWVALRQSDAPLAARVLAHLDRVRLDTVTAQENGLRSLEFYRYLVLLQSTGGDPDSAFTQIGIRDLADQPGSLPPERFAADLSGYGFYRAQLALSRGLRASTAPAGVRAAHAWAEAIARAGLGQWRAVAAPAAAFPRESTEPRAALWSYGLAATGHWLGGLSADEVAPLRALAVRSPASRTEVGRAELEWIDGIVAVAGRDRSTLAARRAALEQSRAGASGELARSLRAFESALAGSEDLAADSLAALELEMPRRGWIFDWGNDHPFLNPVNRVAASRRLMARGDSAGAVRLMRWREAVLPGQLYPASEASWAIADAAAVTARRP